MPKHLDDLTKKELAGLAKEEQIRGYSSMTKAELLKALEKAERSKKKRESATDPAAAPRNKPLPPKEAAATPAAPDRAPKEATALPKVKQMAAPETSLPTRAQPAAAAKDVNADQPEPEAVSQVEGEADELTSELAAQARKYEPRARGVNEQLLDEWAELPATYGQNRITLLPVDPYHLHSYWELTEEAVAQARAQGGVLPVLRLYDVTDLVFNGYNAHSHVDIERGEIATSWYLQIPQPQRSYLVDIGYLARDGRLLVLARSNAAVTPPADPSPVIEERFVTIPFRVPLSVIRIDEEQPGWSPAPGPPVFSGPAKAEPSPAGATAATVSRPAFTPGVRQVYEQLAEPTWQRISLPGGSEVWQLGSEGRQLHFLPGEEQWGGASELVSSWAWGSAHLAASVPPGRERRFWLVADAELIVYGATEPDASLTVQGRPVALRPDGTFTLRFSLPDGFQDIPIHAVAADGEQERGITITVRRETTS